MKILNRYYGILLFSLIAISVLITANSAANAQSWVAEAQQNGFKLKKVVSDTTIATGQTFSYTIYFTIPVNASNVMISDVLPSTVEFLGHSYTSACGTPAVSAPAVNSMGGTYSLSWASVPGGCTGSITLTMQFPNGVTCDGTAARNNVCMSGRVGETFTEFCTPYVSTVAQASNPWHINKYPLDLSWQGGSCSYASGSDTITYRICVYKNVGTTGQLNLANGIVTDTLPAGATLVNSSCGATQSGNVITWNVGNMSALPSYNSACCEIDVYYPPGLFPSGSLITNQATLAGDLGPANQPCDSFTDQSAETCVELVSLTSGSVNKWVYTNRQPGCGGRYLIYICNTGTTNLIVSAQDTLPAALTGYSLGSGNLNSTFSGGIVSMTDTLPPGDCGYQYIEFTIPDTATIGSTIENCVTLDIQGQPVQTICRSFTVSAPDADPCLWKEVCDKQPDYQPGDVFRYRLRIQNVGGLPITGATLSDVLDPNLEYVGNPSYYTDNSWNTPCTMTPSNPWTGVSLNYNSGTNTVTAIIDTIPATCQDIFYTNCGMYGTYGVPFYFIEFDVKVADTSALGNIANEFEISGGNLTSTHTSNTTHVLVTGVVGYNLEKGVKEPSASTYDTLANTSAGSTVDYQLQMNSSGTAALRHVTFVDLLPRNDGTNDSQILQACGLRGSQFDLTYNSLIGSTPGITQLSNPATSLADVNILAPSGAPGPVFTLGCGTSGSWGASWTAGQKNLAAYFGSAAIGTGASVEFKADISSSANVSELACNTFAASGWTKHLIQNSLPSFQLAGELESPQACVKIDSAQQSGPCLEKIEAKVECDGFSAAGVQQYVITLSGGVGCTPAILILSSPDGPFSPSTFNLTSAAWSISTGFTNNTGNNPIKINYTVICENEECRDSLFIDLPPCDDPPPQEDCCKGFMHEFKDTKLHYNNSGVVNLGTSMIAGPSGIKKFRATIVSAQLKKVCWFNTGSWQRIFGDITGGNLVTAPAAGPQLLDIYSREATWGPGECIDWNQGAQLDLNMIFPPFNNQIFCRDTLWFKIRYTFTDCECRTCDTLVTYNVVRRWKWTPWDDVFRPGKLKDIGGKTSRNDDKISAEQPESTSLIMDDANKGSLWIISPDADENDITVTGVEFRSSEAQVTGLSLEGGQGIVQDDIAYIQTVIAPGEDAEIMLTFDNSAARMKFPVFVRYAYTVEGFDDTYFTEPIEYTALVPGAASDDLAIDADDKPKNVRSYALYFSASNGYEQNVSAIGIKPTENMRILAVGPPNEDGENTYVVPRRVAEDSYIITALDLGTAGIESGESMSPVYITVSGGNDTAVIEFTTYDENGNVISKGTLELSDPISSIGEGSVQIDSDVSIKSILPNPANHTVTITYSTDQLVNNAKMDIVNMQGISVVNVLKNKTLGFGSHIKVIDISELPSGIYTVMLRTPAGTVTKPLSIVR